MTPQTLTQPAVARAQRDVFDMARQGMGDAGSRSALRERITAACRILTKLRTDPARATHLLRGLIVLTNLEVNR
ncbi:hypothetical protein ACIQU6_09600 [Streptomyces sp. NPDC090442]|uniref:hypothetical protein n=1 Tax=Streptomyces sp. NPDC090442 TaxID=3365962 RepID=UPI003823A765